MATWCEKMFSVVVKVPYSIAFCRFAFIRIFGLKIFYVVYMQLLRLLPNLMCVLNANVYEYYLYHPILLKNYLIEQYTWENVTLLVRIGIIHL